MQESRLRNSLRQWRQEARARASPFGDQSENHRRSTQRNASETDDLKDEIIVRAKEAKPMAHVQTISAAPTLSAGFTLKNNDERAQAERQAVNTVCQGSAADIFKTAVLLVMDTLRAKFLLERCQLVLTSYTTNASKSTLAAPKPSPKSCERPWNPSPKSFPSPFHSR